MENPFSLSFGKSPIELIERPLPKNEILDSFCTERINQQIYIITGVRGSGKTVLMTEVSDRLKTDENWIVLECNPESDLLSDFASKLSSVKQCEEIFRSAKINLSFFGFGIEIKNEPQIRNLETAVFRMLDSLNRKGKRVLVTIDEVTNSSSMRSFSASFQIFIRQNLPIFLLMTGLYENIDDLQNEKSLTFLYRAPKIHLTSLNLTAVASRYRSLFHLTKEDASEMARLTNGYPFAFQALGYLTWQKGGSYKDVLDSYRLYLEDFVYDKLWSELSEKDKLVAHAMAESANGSVKEIMHEIGLAPNEFSPYRKRLIRKGLADGSRRGYLSFTLPLFDEFVKDQL
jgi:AAA+ ATPase superfamily predicted ATPase